MSYCHIILYIKFTNIKRFNDEMINVSIQVMKFNFKYFIIFQGNGASSKDSLKMYESQLMKLEPPVTISKTTAFVPSFLEDWVFYQISFRKET